MRLENPIPGEVKYAVSTVYTPIGQARRSRSPRTPYLPIPLPNAIGRRVRCSGQWIVRYARPRCEECVKLSAETSSTFQEYLSAKDELTLTSKIDAAYLEKRKHLDKVTGQLREARKREDFHENTHQDEYSN